MNFNTSVDTNPVQEQIRPPQSPLELAAQVQALRAGKQQMQANEQAMQTHALQQDQMRLEIDKNKALNDAYREAFTQQPDGSIKLDMGKMSQILAQRGHGEAIPAIQEHQTKYEQSLAALRETKDKHAAAEAEAAGNLGAMVQAANNDPAVFHTMLTDSINRGDIDKTHFAPLDQQLQQSMAQDSTGEQARQLVKSWTDQMIAGSKDQSKLALDRTKEKREQASADTAKAEAQVKADQAKREQYAREHPDDPQAQAAALTADQRMQLKERADQIAKLNTPSELAFKASDPNASPQMRKAAQDALKILEQHAIASRPIIQTVVPGLGPGQDKSQATGEAFLSTLPPGTAAQVKAIAEGRSVMPSGSTRSQAALQLRDAVFKFDPSFSEQRAQVRKAFAANSNIRALNTATVHLDQLSEVAKALQNGSFRPGNEVFNSARTMFGGAMPLNFEALKSAVAGELANALKGQATDPEIANISKSISAANSPDQLAGVIDTHIHTLGAKLNTFQEQYRQQIPGDTVWSPVLPSARAVYQKHGFDPTAGPGAAQTGKPKPLSEIFK